MPRFLIELSHDDEHAACVKALQSIMQSGSHLMTQLEWGCKSGIHCGWLIVELENSDQAMHVVPPGFRHEARIIELERFTKEQIASLIADLEK
jgi:hypothetical protein